MDHQARFFGGLAAVFLLLAMLAGCGSGSSDPETTNPKFEHQVAPAPPPGAVAQEGKERQKPESRDRKGSSSRKGPHESHQPASGQAGASEPARSHRKPSPHSEALAAVEEIIAADGGGGNVKRTASTPKEMREVLAEVKHPTDQGSSADAGSGSSAASSSDPVQAALEEIGR